MKKLNKKIVVLIISVIVILCTERYFYNKKVVEKERLAEAQEFLKKNEIERLTYTIDGYEYTDSGFLRKGLTSNDTLETEKELDSVISNSASFEDVGEKDSKINKQLKEVNQRAVALMDKLKKINEKVWIQYDVNTLYKFSEVQPTIKMIDGKEVTKSPVIKSGVTEEQMRRAKNHYVEEKGGVKLSDWQKAINELIKNAERQYK
ncbi:hypothetical protein ACQKD9_26605 [Bacillus paramycoides]|uniref:hypothetical protein n=1 Tax=Bacillus paramycoides TaxID=2026194 RepID=UPI003CFEF195